MARTDARNIYINDNDKDKLSEIYGGVIDSVQKGAVSEQIKNKNYSGDPKAGSVEISRFVNATVKDQGTARAGGKGDKLIDKPVTVNVDTDKEIVEEFNKTDLRLHGVTGIAEKRKGNHSKRMEAYLDSEFFACAVSEGTNFNTTGDNIIEKLESLILNVETTTNDYVDGVDRDMLVLVVKPAIYSAIKLHINEVANSLTGVTDKYFNNVRIFSNHRQTKDAICMIDGAVAQPVVADEYDVEKIPLSNNYGLELFFSKGTKAIMPDLIKYANITSASV
ncbi:MAG: hypothetical protein J6Y29_03820 [Clostridiales bacterium]|nr:hypothetical protein [Clostridiales bacterium]